MTDEGNQEFEDLTRPGDFWRVRIAPVLMAARVSTVEAALEHWQARSNPPSGDDLFWRYPKFDHDLITYRAMEDTELPRILTDWNRRDEWGRVILSAGRGQEFDRYDYAALADQHVLLLDAYEGVEAVVEDDNGRWVGDADWDTQRDLTNLEREWLDGEVDRQLADRETRFEHAFTAPFDSSRAVPNPYAGRKRSEPPDE